MIRISYGETSEAANVDCSQVNGIEVAFHRTSVDKIFVTHCPGFTSITAYDANHNEVSIYIPVAMVKDVKQAMKRNIGTCKIIKRPTPQVF